MQAVKLVIPGEYWDSQLYSGRLYLFGNAGELTIIDWDKAIDNQLFSNDQSLKIAGQAAFLESNLFYEKGVQLMLQDPKIKNILFEKFESLAKANIQLDLRDTHSPYIFRIDNPLPFPHVDSEIYYGKLYVSLKEGVFYSERNRDSIKNQPIKVWDTPTFDITASKSYTTIAYAAGFEGLFQQKIESETRNKDQNKPTLISCQHCTTCKWSDFNIYATSHIHESFFAAFKKTEDKNNKRKCTREFTRVISAAEIFDDGGFSWGVQDKLYVYHNQVIDAIKYSSTKDGRPLFDTIGHIPIDIELGEVVSAEVAPFGNIIEFENAIIIIQSDGQIFTIPGEPVNWRVFSRSQKYTNQLHIIYEDRLEIFSFYNDYFIKQNDKISGFTVS